MKKGSTLSRFFEFICLCIVNKLKGPKYISTPEKEDIANGYYTYDEWERWHNRK